MGRVAAAVLFVAAAFFLTLAWETLNNLWADYQDSPDSTYLGFGGVWLAFAAVCTWAGVFVLRR